METAYGFWCDIIIEEVRRERTRSCAEAETKALTVVDGSASLLERCECARAYRENSRNSPEQQIQQHNQIPLKGKADSEQSAHVQHQMIEGIRHKRWQAPLALRPLGSEGFQNSLRRELLSRSSWSIRRGENKKVIISSECRKLF